MDSVTHIVLGACIGEVIAGKELGRKAMLWGALAQTFPDIDVVAEMWLDTPSNLLAHRGFTHSILSCLLFTPLFAAMAKRIHSKVNISMQRWMALFCIEMFCHLLLDSQNAYGTGLFEPFSHARVSFNTMFVADPLFTIVALVASIVLLIFRKKEKRRFGWATAGIVASALYLSVCIINKLVVTSEVNTLMQKQNVTYTQSFVTPTPLNNLLWYVVANDDKGSYVGYRSIFDKKPEFELTYFKRNDELLHGMEGDAGLQKLKRFSKGYYIAQEWRDRLVFSDLRFGQILGWKDPKEKFVFHYYLKHPNENKVVIQRGRFAKWDNTAIPTLWQRMMGI